MPRPILAVLLCTLLCALLPATPASAVTIHVPADYPLIADAMVFASRGDTVLVACGTYNEGNIQMKNGVTLISETGDVGCVTISGQNLSRIIECVDCDDTTAIIGIRFVNGVLTAPGAYGGGMACSNSSPWLENLEFVFCQVVGVDAQGGGGLGCLNSSPTLTNVYFYGCIVDDATSHGGGAMVALGSSYPTLNDVEFNTNWVTDSWGGALSIEGYGGGVVRLNDVIFEGNQASLSGGGGGIHIGGSPTVIDGATFHDNWAPYGAGIHFETCRPCTLRNAVFTENTAASGEGGGILCAISPDGFLTMDDVTFIENTAATQGGGMAVSNSTMPLMTRTTFSRNTAYDGGAIAVLNSPVSITSSTFCWNEASNTGGGIFLNAPSELHLDRSIIAYCQDGEAVAQWGYTPPIVTCTDVYGNADGDWVGPLAGLDIVNGNFSLQPLFCESLNNIFTLHEDSPCLPGANGCGVLIGAHGIGCAPDTEVPAEGTSLAVHFATPNPFTHSTALSYVLPRDSIVSARVYDVTGRVIRVLAHAEHQAAGPRSLSWDGRDAADREAASGVYFLRLDIGEESLERRMVLLR